MLEANTFRSMMLVGGVMSLAALVACFFVIPFIEVNAQEKTNYENVMSVDLEEDTDSLTAYQALLFTIQGKTRGNVQHY